MKNILFVHQSSELYGSDKTLLLLVVNFKEKGLFPIVVLPDRGPLFDILEQKGICVIKAPVLKISRKMFRLGNLLSFPYQAYSAIKKIDCTLVNRNIDLVYSNTLAVLTGLLYAKRKKIKHVWHVHEIVQKPLIVKNIFTKLIRLKANNLVIYNSIATKKFWEAHTLKTSGFSVVVWNGVRLEKKSHVPDNVNVKEKLFGFHQDDVVIGLVGRINKWKGQLLLLEAYKKLQTNNPTVKLVFIGSPPPGQDQYQLTLANKIKEYGFEDKVQIIPFQTDIYRIWEAIDIAVVPSTEPEPFGLVAIEAMFCSKPVIAANHGGLTEIVTNNVTGLLFDPGNVMALEKALMDLILHPEKRLEMGEKGFIRANSEFTVEKYVDEIEKLCLNL